MSTLPRSSARKNTGKNTGKVPEVSGNGPKGFAKALQNTSPQHPDDPAKVLPYASPRCRNDPEKAFQVPPSSKPDFSNQKPEKIGKFLVSFHKEAVRFCASFEQIAENEKKDKFLTPFSLIYVILPFGASPHRLRPMSFCGRGRAVLPRVPGGFCPPANVRKNPVPGTGG